MSRTSSTKSLLLIHGRLKRVVPDFVTAALEAYNAINSTLMNSFYFRNQLTLVLSSVTQGVVLYTAATYFY
jgi:hypothetical protein